MNNFTNPYAWLHLFVMALQALVVSWAFVNCFECRTKKIYPILFQTIGSVLVSTPLVLFAFFTPFQSLISITVDVLTGLIFTEKSYPKWRVCSFWIVRIILDGIVEVAIMLFLTAFNMADKLTVVTDFNFERLTGSVWFLIISVPVHFLYSALWNKFANKINIKINRTKIIAIIFPLAWFLILLILVLEQAFFNLSYFNKLILTVSAFVLMSVCIVYFLFFVSDIERKHQLEIDLKELEYTYKSEADYYREIENKNYEISKIRHDIKNQIITIKTLRESGNEDEVTALLNELENDINNATFKKYCQIPVVNAIISEKENFCKKKDINLYINISIDNIGEISNVHISSIFSNLMDNAINCILKNNDAEKYIKLSAIQRGEYIIVSCSNPVSETKNRILNPEESKGYGLKILKDISQKYDGAFKAEIKNGVCETEIMVHVASIV